MYAKVLLIIPDIFPTVFVFVRVEDGQRRVVYCEYVLRC